MIKSCLSFLTCLCFG